MKSTLSNLLMFAAGAAIGVSVTWRYFEKKYKRIADEEIESMREYYLKKKQECEGLQHSSDNDQEKAHASHEKPNIREYAAKIDGLGYTDYSSADKTVQKENNDVAEPYVISPEEYGELHEYETIELFHYADGILADEMDVVVDDADEIVGPDYADHFGEYEDDSVFIRNDDRKCDYQILLSAKCYYGEVVNDHPHQAEDE